MSRFHTKLLSAAAMVCAAAVVIGGQAQSLSAPEPGSGPAVLGIGSYSPIVGDLERSLDFYARVGLDIPAPIRPGPRLYTLNQGLLRMLGTPDGKERHVGAKIPGVNM